MGPASSSYEKISALVDAGMNVARINFSHGTYDQHAAVIATLKRVRSEKGVPLSIMLDTKGPEVRLGEVKDGAIQVSKGDRLRLTSENSAGGAIQITPIQAYKALEAGCLLLIDDGYISARVLSKSPEGVEIEIRNPGFIKSFKSLSLQGVDLLLPAMTEQDRLDIHFGCEQGVDLIAASFIRSANHVAEIKGLLLERGSADIQVMAKIENPMGVENFNEIVAAADGIMVARGDLGVELPLKSVPRLQKMMIRKCCLAAKPVITATQMLESMINNPRPTRAEVSDVANAIYDSTSSVMLSGETAVGRYPVETVEMMGSIIEESENDFDFENFFMSHKLLSYENISASIAFSAVNTAYTTKAGAIFCFTHSGFTARILSKFRPRMPIIALTRSEKVYHQLALNWGVIPLLLPEMDNFQDAFAQAAKFAVARKILQRGDLVVVTSGEPFWESGTTNVMLVHSIP